MPTDSKLVLNLTRENVICEHTIIADGALTRMRGLLGRRSLAPGEGLLLQPARSIHTGFMRFPIDTVFFDRNLKVVKLVEALRPWRAASARHARSVLELSAGVVQDRGVEPGDQLIVVDSDPAATALELAPNPAEGVLEPATPDPTPIRVLLVSGDRRFRAVAATLMTRRGAAVVIPPDPTMKAAELARDEYADVVVVDGASLSMAVQTAIEIENLNPTIGIVVVSDEPYKRFADTPPLRKWGSFAALYSAIEHACPITNLKPSDASR